MAVPDVVTRYHWYFSVIGAGDQVPAVAVMLVPTLAVPEILGSGAVSNWPRGVTGALSVDEVLVPAVLCAVTENVYGVPLVRPVMVQLWALVVQVLPSGVLVTV